jgi:glutamate-1-semialdehyde 2,1-aminomutase
MKSNELFDRARELIPGGVSSPVRAIRPYPFYTRRARGSKIYTVEGRELTDYCMGYGPMILGHAHPVVMDAISAQLHEGWLYGTPVPLEIELAELICGDHPSIDMCRFVSSGSEATMSAIRLARGFTGRKRIIKIEGGFHGAHDGVLIKAGSGATTLGIPDSAGVLPEIVAQTGQAAFNDAEAIESLLSGDEEIAAVIMEPVMGNVGPILPDEGYLEEVRAITQEHDVLLIFDEVITGYRLGIGGAQKYYGITPDLTTLGKICGGGLPIGIFGGRKDIMEMVAPSGPVYQAGTFSGNPLSLAAGISQIRYLHEHPEIYPRLAEKTRMIREGIGEYDKGSFVSIGSMFKFFFSASAPVDYLRAKESDTKAFGIFWKKMLENGIFIPPSQFETNFLSTAHTDSDIEQLISAYRSCL